MTSLPIGQGPKLRSAYISVMAGNQGGTPPVSKPALAVSAGCQLPSNPVVEEKKVSNSCMPGGVGSSCSKLSCWNVDVVPGACVFGLVQALKVGGG